MTILEELRQASIVARKERNPKASFLVTLYSECAMVGKTKRNLESTDEEVILVLKKFKAGAESIIENALIRGAEGDLDLMDVAVKEIAILDKFLPTMISDEKLTSIVEGFINTLDDKSTKQKGLVMGYLKKEFAGLYDGKVAMEIISKLLK